MSTPQPPLRQPTQDEIKEVQKYATALHRAAIFTIIVAPLLAALPPRKLDAYTLGLVGLTGFSGNYLYKESRGNSIWHVIGGNEADTIRKEKETAGEGGIFTGGLPTQKAREFQHHLKEMRLQHARAEGKPVPDEDVKKGTIIDQVYYGSEKPEGWRERRAREDQEKLDQGKGYGDIIMEQIWDVWNWNYGDKKNTNQLEKKE